MRENIVCDQYGSVLGGKSNPHLFLRITDYWQVMLCAVGWHFSQTAAVRSINRHEINISNNVTVNSDQSLRLDNRQ